MAVKKIDKTALNLREKQFLRNELMIISMINHPNIVEVHEYFETKKWIYIAMECVTGGELFKYLDETSLSEYGIAFIMKQLLEGVQYLHCCGVMHRDLKPENILLEANKEFDQIKIIDFGTSLVYDPNRSLDEKLGTPYYIAPEVLNKNYDSKCDIWSCGVITYILLSGMPPFNGQSDQDIMKKVRQGAFDFEDRVWSNISDKAKDFITQLLTYNKDERPSAEVILQHAWLEELANLAVDESLALSVLDNMKGFRVD